MKHHQVRKEIESYVNHHSIKDNDDLKRAIRSTFGTESGRRLLKHLYCRNVLVREQGPTVVVTDANQAFEVGKLEGRRQLILLLLQESGANFDSENKGDQK